MSWINGGFLINREVGKFSEIKLVWWSKETGSLFVYFDSNDVNVLKFAFGKGEKCCSNVKAIFSNAMLSCYLYFLFALFYFLIITFEIYNNIDSKTKALFTLYKKFENFECCNEDIVFLRKNWKIDKRWKF